MYWGVIVFNCVSHQNATFIYDASAIHMPAINMIFKCHTSILPHVQIWGKYVIIYASYELSAINNVTRSPCIHTLHIIVIFPWTNMSDTLQKKVSLHCYSRLLINPTYQSNTTNCNIYSPCSCHVCFNNKYPWQLPHLSHVCKLLNVHQWGEYANMWDIWSHWHETCDQEHWTHDDDDNKNTFLSLHLAHWGKSAKI